MFKSNGGFTLVELIVVIAILAILASVTVPAYNGYIEKAKAVQAQVDAHKADIDAKASEAFAVLATVGNAGNNENAGE